MRRSSGVLSTNRTGRPAGKAGVGSTPTSRRARRQVGQADRRAVRVHGASRWLTTCIHRSKRRLQLMLQLNDVVKHYRVGDGEVVRAVDGVRLSVGAGELVALYGPSGSGKTTLLMLIAGLLIADSGSVRVNGREVSTLSERERAHYRRSELGFIRQSLDLIPGVRADDNAALKLLATSGRREAQRSVAPLLERLGLNGRALQRAEQLSMGERQRVMIARALSTAAETRPRRRADRQPRQRARSRSTHIALRGVSRTRGRGSARHTRSQSGRVRRPRAHAARRTDRRVRARACPCAIRCRMS